MYYVDLLKGNDQKLYVGYSSDLKRRTMEHLNKKVYTTKRIEEPRLVYYEAYIIDKENAKLRERKLKQYGSSYHGLLKRICIKK